MLSSLHLFISGSFRCYFTSAPGVVGVWLGGEWEGVIAWCYDKSPTETNKSQPFGENRSKIGTNGNEDFNS